MLDNMTEYTLDDLEKFNFTEFQQMMMFGNTINEMRKLKPNGTIQTWIRLEDQFELKKS